MRNEFLSCTSVCVSLLSLFLPFALAAAAEDAPTYKVKKIKDLVYFNGPGQDPNKHKLDLYLPEGKKAFPVLFFVHGGAWTFGDRNFFGVYSTLASFYANQGIGVVVISYRLSPGVTHPEHVKDVARAFAWTHKHIPTYGGRADQVFVSGHSAGGHLAALLATDESYLKAHDLTSRAIRGVIPISGVYIVPVGFFPKVFGTDADASKKASPLTHVREALPPFLILYADHDLPGCDRRPSEAFTKALKDKGVRADLVEIKDGNHYSILLDAGKPGTKTSSAILDFIRRHTDR